jgi:hypothetical protein
MTTPGLGEQQEVFVRQAGVDLNRSLDEVDECLLKLRAVVGELSTGITNVEVALKIYGAAVSGVGVKEYCAERG